MNTPEALPSLVNKTRHDMTRPLALPFQNSNSTAACAGAAVLLGSSGYLPVVVFYPAMLWVVGGRWWGLLGMVFHLALLLKGVLQDVSQLNGFLVSWTLFAWACSLRCVPLGCWPFPGMVFA